MGGEGYLAGLWGEFRPLVGVLIAVYFLVKADAAHQCLLAEGGRRW